jgi:hypothetical protein
MTTFGRSIVGQSADTILTEEREQGNAPPFAEIDAVTTELVIASLGGQRVAVIEEREKRIDLELPPLTGDERGAVARVFTLPAQQARGAWFLPEEAAVRTGSANLPYHFTKYARFASSVARDEKTKVAFGSDPDALYYWAVLDLLFAGLFLPFDLRGPAPANASEQQEAWTDVDTLYSALGIDGGEPLARMRYGAGWGRFRSAEQLAVKQDLLAQLRRSVHGSLAARYRAWTCAPLIERYYAKAKKAPPLMRQVLTKPLQRTLCAFFGGDWLALVRYLGEQPHPAEQIASALPEPRIYVETGARAAAVATARGIPPSEVDRIIAMFWASDTSQSPVHKRLDVFREFWRAFDATHARQASGMASLWGFVEDIEHVDFERELKNSADTRLYNRGSYRAILPNALTRRVDELWGGVFLPTYPDAIVTALDPYARMCGALGPALKFWNGLALTAWFVAEGPSSRTDMKGAEKYYERDLDMLEAMRCPVDRAVFAELVAAEAALGPAEPIDEKVEKTNDPDDDDMDDDIRIVVTMQIVTNRGYRRAGFERLRDTVTGYRRAWTEKYLETYLRALWEAELKETAREYNKLFEVKRKVPTLRQFAKYAVEPTNRWFGGDVSQLYRALGEKSPVAPVRRRVLHESPAWFAQRVFTAIGGVPTSWEEIAATIVGRDRAKQDAAWRAHQDRVKLATLSLKYVQLREALDRPPTLMEFGPGSFYYLAPVLDPSLNDRWPNDRTAAGGITAYQDMKARVDDVGPAWDTYTNAIEQCLRVEIGQ